MTASESPLIRDRLRTQILIQKLINLGRPVIEGTDLVIPGTSLTQKDVRKTQELIQTISPVTIENYHLHAHFQDSARAAKEVAQSMDLPESTMHLVTIGAQLHDLGRVVTHRWGREELVGRALLRRLGVREDIIETIPDVFILVGKDPSDDSQVSRFINNLTAKQKIVMTGDLLGKRRLDEEGVLTSDLLTFEEVIEAGRKSRSDYQNYSGLVPIWPSERALNPTLIDFAEKVYRRVYAWFSDQGVDLEEVRRSIIENEAKSPLGAVLFDRGKVIIPYDDNQFIADLAQSTGLDKATIEGVLGELIPLWQAAEIDSNGFEDMFFKMTGCHLPEKYGSFFTHALEGKEDPQMLKLIEDLKGKGLTVGVFSDSIPPDKDILLERGAYAVFDARTISSETGVSKKSKAAYWIAALRVNLPPAACLFIDDKQEYVERARQAGMKAIRYQLGENKIDELRSQLEEYGLGR